MEVTINGGNYYNEIALEKIIKELEDGKRVNIFIDCTGHTRAYMEEARYREKLTELYGDKLTIIGETYFKYELIKEK